MAVTEAQLLASQLGASTHRHQGMRGYLKIFLGYASGVGKSLRMFDEARRRHDRGQDVAVAAVQPTTPPAIEAVLQKIEVIPLRTTKYGSAIDIDAVLARLPEVCFIDALAYDNPPGSRNATRWQDVRDLVNSGIKVVTSINIQYIDEMQQTVEAITGKHVTQTVPISFIKSADEIEIVDAPPIEVRGDTAEERAGVEERQYRLSRLRELALVLAADVVDYQLASYLDAHGIRHDFATVERILVCLTGRSDASAMLSLGRIVAERFYGELIAIHVDGPRISASERTRVTEKLALARELGARVEVLHGTNPVASIIDFARIRGITQIYVGHSRRSGVVSKLRRSRLHDLIRRSRGMDVRIFPNEP